MCKCIGTRAHINNSAIRDTRTREIKIAITRTLINNYYCRSVIRCMYITVRGVRDNVVCGVYIILFMYMIQYN